MYGCLASADCLYGLLTADKQPDLVVLLGPFVDVEHPAVRDCTINKTFDAVFRDEVSCELAGSGGNPCIMAASHIMNLLMYQPPGSARQGRA